MAKSQRVLVVEDDAVLAEQLRWALQDDYRLELAADRPSAIELLPICTLKLQCTMGT